MIEVWDTGIGVPDDQHENIFSDFIQLDNPERDRRKGLGLGLAIARRLARMLDSDVTLRSVHSRGSVFRFSLPRAAAAEVLAPDAGLSPATPRLPYGGASGAAAGHSAQVPRILILDDDTAILQGLEALLAAHGFPVAAAETVEDAIALSVAQPPDLLICDFRLRGGRDGTEAARWLRHHYRPDMPVLMITGDTHPDRIVEAEREGLSMLYKPIDPEGILAAIRELV